MNGSKCSMVMPQEVSALNTTWLIEYLEQHHPKVNLQEILEHSLTDGADCVINSLTGLAERVTLFHLKSPGYWFSHQFVLQFYSTLQDAISDPMLGYRVGSCIYKYQPVVKTTIGVALLGVHRVIQKVSREVSRFNRTARIIVRWMGEGHTRIRIIHNPGVVVNEFIMQWIGGYFSSYTRLCGASEIHLSFRCIDRGPVRQADFERAIWDFDLHYNDPGLIPRMTRGALCTLPWVRDLSERAATDEQHRRQIIDQGNLIKTRTRQLHATQHKLMKREQEVLSEKLQEISLHLASEEGKEIKTIAEDLHDSVSHLLANSLNMVKMVSSTKKRGDDDLQQVEESLGQALSDLQLITHQINPPILHELGLEAALEWLIEDFNQRHGIYLKFTNLLAFPIEMERAQRIILYHLVRDVIVNILKRDSASQGGVTLNVNGESLLVEVSEKGGGPDAPCVGPESGFSKHHDRLFDINGSLKIVTRAGGDTVATLTIPLRQNGARQDREELAAIAA